jgi:uncharacterized RDD family membrane protein YckC
VRDVATGQYPTMGKAALRGFIWTLEYALTFCLVGALGWLWMLWDPQKQAIHDKIARTIVTTSWRRAAANRGRPAHPEA